MIPIFLKLQIFLFFHPRKVNVFLYFLVFFLINFGNLDIASCTPIRPTFPESLLEYIPQVGIKDRAAEKILMKLALNQHESISKIEYDSITNRFSSQNTSLIDEPNGEIVRYRFRIYLKECRRFMYGR